MDLNKTFKAGIVLFVLVISLSLLFMPLDNKSIDISYIDDLSKKSIYTIDNNMMVSKTDIVIKEDNLSLEITKLIEVLTIGNANNNLLKDGFSPLLPSDTKINSVKIVNDVARIDLSGSIKNNLDEKMIEAISYTINDIEGILGVELYIDGKILKYIPTNNKTLPTILTKDFGINKEYNITDYKDVSKVTIYYVSKYNDNNYYVPVTKYLNDTREKIEIIIDELTSNYIYETNLMSFLNNNVRLISYEMKDDTLELMFNELFFSEDITHSVLEEVIYTISYSVFDNYDVNNIVFMADDLEVTKINRENL